jgi:hypothetical protein
MKELKSIKTGLTTICTEEEYAYIVNHKPHWLKRFEVTDIKGIKQIIPSIKVSEAKEVPIEIKKIHKK